MSSTTAAATTAAATTAAATTAATTAATSEATLAPTTAPTQAASSSAAQYGILLMIIFLTLSIVSIYCIIKSLMCFGKSGSTAEKVIGVIIAFLTGPFYLLYLNFNEGYCKNEEPVSSPPMVGGRRRK